MEILLAVVSFIFVIGVMVLVHEWGHFIAAKRLGILVEAFSIGFGPKLIAWKRGDTEYRICAIPFGGYVKMLAENPDEGPTGDPREFLSRSRLERFFVLVMGPLLNLVLAIVLWAGVMMLGEEKEKWLTEPVRVDFVEPGGPAEKAGMQTGDIVTEINNAEMAHWEDLLYFVASHPREDLDIKVERDGEEIVFEGVRPSEDTQSGIGRIGISPGYPPIIHEMTEDGPAELAGLKEGDRIVSFYGEEITTFNNVVSTVQARSQSILTLEALYYSGPFMTPTSFLFESSSILDLDIEVERENETITTTIQPEYDFELGFYRIGITRPPMPTITVHRNPLEAIWGALERSVVTTGRLFDLIGKMVTGRMSTKAVSGPVEIAAISGKTAEQGIIPLLNLMAFISLNLGIFNLLPLPILDGGNIFILAIEGIFRRDLSLKTKEWIMKIGIVFILLLFALILYQDIYKLFARMG